MFKAEGNIKEIFLSGFPQLRLFQKQKMPEGASLFLTKLVYPKKSGVCVFVCIRVFVYACIRVSGSSIMPNRNKVHRLLGVFIYGITRIRFFEHHSQLSSGWPSIPS